jgi:hypothetical protein
LNASDLRQEIDGWWFLEKGQPISTDSGALSLFDDDASSGTASAAHQKEVAD